MQPLYDIGEEGFHHWVLTVYVPEYRADCISFVGWEMTAISYMDLDSCLGWGLTVISYKDPEVGADCCILRGSGRYL